MKMNKCRERLKHLYNSHNSQNHTKIENQNKEKKSQRKWSRDLRLWICIIISPLAYTNRVHNVASAPEYISKFIQTNMEKLMDIYEEGIDAFGSGCMMFLCSEENNKMDVQFMNDEIVIPSIIEK